MILLRRSQAKSASERRKGYSQRKQRSLKAEKIGYHTTFSTSKAPKVNSTQPLVNIESFLAQQADDDSVRQKTLILFDQVELHIENFYREHDAGLSIEQESELSRYGSPALAIPLVALLETSHRKTAVIKHCLGLYAVNIILSPINSDNLLPHETSAALALTHAQARGEQTSSDPSEYLSTTIADCKLTDHRLSFGLVALADADGVSAP